MRLRQISILILVLVSYTVSASNNDDLIAEESQSNESDPFEKAVEPPKKYSSRIRAIDSFGLKTKPQKKSEEDERIQTAAAGNGNSKSKEEDDEEKTLAQQVADGKYGLIQNEIFPHGSKRPGIISYLPNDEVPKDTIQNLGGLDKDEIWLAEDHILVLRGGIYSDRTNESYSWPPIDDYVAPTRQVQIPENPSVPPPFPVQLHENGPLQFIKGPNGTYPTRPPYLPPYPFPPVGGEPNKTVPFPIPPGNFPNGAAFLPPPGNLSDFDEDDPSIYYPPKYDFIYRQPNASLVPPGPLVPGIVLPPPPNFFSPEKNETEKPSVQENETDYDEKPQFIGPAYLPVRNTFRPRPTLRPPPERTTVAYVYPENKTVKQPIKGFTSPIYVPNKMSPKPNHISLPADKPLKQDIYIITTQPPEVDNTINDIPKKPTKPTIYDNISPEIHPLRSLIRPNVSVSYIGKVGHLPASTPFPFPKKVLPTGHFITLPPDVTVTPVPIVKKIRVQPNDASTQSTPHATFYFYEEPRTTVATVEENEVSASPIEPYEIPNKAHRAKGKYHFTAEAPKLSALEIEHAGLSGLQSVKTTTTTPAPAMNIPKTPLLRLTTPRPLLTTDSPFIPSNYYATADPSNVHFTPLDHSLVDDMTMKYFTIFGKKINGVTTPLTPTSATTTTTKKYTSTPKSVFITKSKPVSQFEQYLKEITGEDQKDFIQTQNLGALKKKAKSRPIPKINIYKHYQQPTGLSQYLEDIYHPTYSTTLRPVLNSKPEYLSHISTTQRPFGNNPSVILPPSHNFGQYLQEVTPYTKLGPSNLQYFDASTPTPSHHAIPPNKPISLEGDILVNFRRPLPAVDPDAEFIPNYFNPTSNIKVVDAPDLSRKRPYRPYPPIRKSQPLNYPKTFFENIPQSGYFAQPAPNTANAFISYNLPGNGGHFYFLTPQAVERSDDVNDDDVHDNLNYVKRSDGSHRSPRRWARDPSTQDFHRRRRKRP